MIFRKTSLAGLILITPEPQRDERGSFARIWCRHEFEEAGLETDIAQSSLSFNRRCGTLRGLHFQRPPHEETKLVRCTRGAVFDVALDLRPHSPTYRSWQGFELSAENGAAIHIPQGFAHGFQTLTDDSEVLYQISAFYAPGAAAGVRHDDPAFGIVWPLEVTEISDKDRAWPDYRELTAMR
jgi:dTDP-4-dehydrorhamnose 3,5-epimerase